MSKWELERKAGQLACQLDDVRERINAITREYDALVVVRPGQVVATTRQLREPVSAVRDGLPKTARSGWIPVATLAVGVLLVPLALRRGRSPAKELLETVTHDARKVTDRAGAYTSDIATALRNTAERQAACLPDQVQAITDTLTASIRRTTA